MAQQKVVIDVPKYLSPSDRIALGQDIIQHIIKRTQSGISASGDRFTEYSKAYAQWKGVPRKKVDLTLTEGMLEAIKVLTQRPGKVTVGFDAGTFENDKAEGNQKVMGRPFLGISQAELKALVREYKAEREDLEDDNDDA